MRTLSNSRRRVLRRYPAFSYLETLFSVVIVGTTMVVGMKLHSSYARGVIIDREMLIADGLAQDLLSEILTKHFENPASAAGSFGPETGEKSRATFNDVDDYDGWSESPPTDMDGIVIDAELYAGYSRTVLVVNTNEDTLATAATDGSTAAKLIIVIVAKGGKLRGKAYGWRMRHRAYD